MNGAVTATPNRLYSPRLLMLSARLAEYPQIDGLPFNASARSRTCGSMIELGLDLDGAGSVSRIGMMVTACAVGQSSAAIMAGGIIGVTRDHIAATKAAIEHWLEDEGDPPDWPEFDALIPALGHRGRYEALLLPWKAAVEALSTRGSSS